MQQCWSEKSILSSRVLALVVASSVLDLSVEDLFLVFFFLKRASISVMSTSSAGATCGDMLREIHFSRPLFLLSIDDDKGFSLLPFDRDEGKSLSVANMPRKESTRLITSCEGSD